MRESLITIVDPRRALLQCSSEAHCVEDRSKSGTTVKKKTHTQSHVMHRYVLSTWRCNLAATCELRSCRYGLFFKVKPACSACVLARAHFESGTSNRAPCSCILPFSAKGTCGTRRRQAVVVGCYSPSRKFPAGSLRPDAANTSGSFQL